MAADDADSGVFKGKRLGGGPPGDITGTSWVPGML